MTLQTTDIHPASRRPSRLSALRHLKPLKSGRSVLDALVEMIDAANIQVGDRLPPEIELARRLNVGRSTIREALTTWQSMGIVVRNKGAGTILATEVSARSVNVPLTIKLEAESLLRTRAVRRPLELEATRLATRQASDKQRKIIIARMAELIAVYEAGEDWRDADHRFHDAIYDTCGNPLFGQIIRQLHQVFQNIYEAPFGKPHLGSDTIPAHKPLAEAIAAGRETQAVRISGEIMDAVEAEVRDTMRGANV